VSRDAQVQCYRCQFSSVVALAVAALLAAHSDPVRAQATPGSQAATSGGAQSSDNGPTARSSASASDLEEVVVTGYRRSLNAALDTKRSAVSSVDQIVADDIAAFPELNLAESIQRVPGVSIVRDAGEGRQISVRGLGPQFTRVRINGMEALTTVSTSDANGGTNRDRSFDFNVFASELFNTVTVHKTATADVDEGSLGATVDLRAARPFDFNGFTLVTGGKLDYNDLATTYNPRATGLISDTFADGKFGILLSAAYTKRAIIDDGSSTVRWMNGLNSDGTASATNDFKTLGTSYAGSGSTATLAQLNAAFRPRLPRYESYNTDQKRIGVTNSIQFKPTDRTLLSLDSLFAQMDGTREETQLEAPIFSSTGATGINQVVVQSAKLDGQNNLIAGTFDNVSIRAEHRFDILDTKFREHVLSFDQTLTDHLKFNASAGWAQSLFTSPVSTTLTWDINHVNGYVYNFAVDPRLPLLSYGNANVANPNAWTLSQIRLRPSNVDNTYKNYVTDLEWAATDSLSLTAGLQLKQYDFETISLRRLSETAIPASVAAAAPATYAQQVGLTGLSVPGGTATSWAVPSIASAASMFNIYDPTLYPVGIAGSLGTNFSVGEKDESGFLQADWNAHLGTLPLRTSLGVRYVKTKQTSTGWTSIASATTGQFRLSTVDHSYDDVLPSLNAVLNVTDDFLIRLAASKVMARAGLGSLNPGAAVSITGQNKTVAAGNPTLDPFRAKAYDMSFEWYFAKESLLSLAFFYKDIDSLVETVRTTQPFSANTSNLPNSVAVATCQASITGFNANDPNQVAACLDGWQMSVPANTPGGSLKGTEISYQQPFSFLPHPLNNFGTILNYTYVDSKVKYYTLLPGTPGANTSFVANSLLNLSKNAANATIYYDNGNWSARVSAAYRSPYLTNVPGQNLNDVEGTHSTLNVDFSSSWNVTQAFQLTLEALNLTNQFQFQYVDSVGDRLSFYHQQGREYLLGARYKF
jgi:iron complex outermembrane recepter protein